MHGVIITSKGLECHKPMELDYYGAIVVASWFNPKLRAYCAGASSTNNIHTLEWRSVLPICPTCLVDGARSLVRIRRRDANVHERRAQRARLVNFDAPQVPDDEEEQVPVEVRARGEATSLVGLPFEGSRVYVSAWTP